MRSHAHRGSPFRSIGAWIPVGLAAAALALLLGYWLSGPHAPHLVVEHGVARAEEGPAARSWQLLMLLQVPFVLHFAAKWLAKDPWRALVMLSIHAAAFAAAALPVLLIGA